jgi:hypothetical protein
MENHWQSLGENHSEFKTVYDTNPTLKTILEDRLIDIMGDLHFHNRSWSISVDFSRLIHGNVPPFNEL